MTPHDGTQDERPDATAQDAVSPATGDPHTSHESPEKTGSRDALWFALGLVGYIGLWAGATALFGFPGLIYPALLAVALISAALVIISRG